LKYAGLALWEIYVSESQERMLLTVPPDNVEKVLGAFGGEDVEATVIGKLISGGLLRLDCMGERVGGVGISFLFKPPRITRTAEYRPAGDAEPTFPEPRDLNEVLMRVLASPNVASKESV